MTPQKRQKSSLESLNSERVKYLIVGGFAVNHYGHTRSTKDLDVWIAVDASNAQLVSRVMRKFGGFPGSRVPPEIFRQQKTNFAFGREPIRIDLLTNIDGVEFEACYQRRVEVIWDGAKVPLISLADLKANKLASSRFKDLADVEALSLISVRKKRRKTRPRRKS